MEKMSLVIRFLVDSGEEYGGGARGACADGGSGGLEIAFYPGSLAGGAGGLQCTANASHRPDLFSNGSAYSGLVDCQAELTCTTVVVTVAGQARTGYRLPAKAW